jgi:hypothetical protein
MKFITGRELKEMFEKGLPLTIEITPLQVPTPDGLQENGLCYDMGFSPGMRADVANVHYEDILEVVLDLFNWESYNNWFDRPNHIVNRIQGEHLNLKWCETKEYPKKVYNGHTIIRPILLVSKNLIHEFTLVENYAQELHQKFLESGHPNYVQWLEGRCQ